MEHAFDAIVKTLRSFYRDDVPSVTKVAEKERDAFLVLVGCILSLRTKDEVTEGAVERLTQHARTPREILGLPVHELERLIYPVGFYRNKARLIKEVALTVIEKYDNKVPDTIDELLTIKGVGRKTANIVITEGFGKPGIAVDTHVHRISNRFGIVSTKTPNDTEIALRRIVPHKYWRIYNPLLVTHGRRTCAPLSPFCGRCPVFDLCRRVGVSRSR